VVLFNKLIQLESALFASTVTYLMPIVAIAWGLFDNEAVSLVQVLAIGIILIGVRLLSKKSSKNSETN